MNHGKSARWEMTPRGKIDGRQWGAAQKTRKEYRLREEGKQQEQSGPLMLSGKFQGG